jgi:hypothetical protein
MWENNSLMGNCTVRTDAATFGNFLVMNTGIASFREINADGTDPDLMVTIRGYYPINQSLFG